MLCLLLFLVTAQLVYSWPDAGLTTAEVKYYMSYCPGCAASTGSCGRHQTWYSLEYFEYSLYPIGPTCLICGRIAQPLALRLPYASQYDGEHICEDCVRHYLDPAIAGAQGLQDRQGQVQVTVNGCAVYRAADIVMDHIRGTGDF